MRGYQPAFERAHTAVELARLAKTIYVEDLECRYITALGAMVAGGVADAELGAEAAFWIEPWIAMVEHKLEEYSSTRPSTRELPRAISHLGSWRAISGWTCSATCSATSPARDRWSTSRHA
jgi:hypothetical protein